MSGSVADTWYAQLSLEDKVGQLIVPRPETLDLSPTHYIDAFSAGGIIVHHGVYSDPAQMATYIADAQRAALARNGVPLLINCDHEGGHTRFMRSVATDVPSNMALGAAADPRIAGEAATLLASELLAVGVNWNLAPVVDVNVNPSNPVIGTRSYGDDPGLVGAYASAAITAYQSAGILACAKHFPGHGDTDVDSHVGLPRLDFSRDRLEMIELAPFREAIASGVGSVMTAHMLVPGLDPEWIGTLSAPILTDLLRRELGHDGLIVTDALEMAGVADILNEPDAAVASVMAGADVLLTGRQPELNQQVFDTLLVAVRSGHIPAARFEMAVRNVLEAKARYAAAQPVPDPERASREVGTPANRQRALEMARRTITLVRDTAGALPLRRDLGASLVVLSPLGSRRTKMEEWTMGRSLLSSEIQTRAPGAVEIPIDYPASAEVLRSIDAAVSGARAVVVGTLNAMLDPDQVAVIERVRDLASNAALVVVGLRTPYDLVAMPWLHTYVCAYTSVDCSMAATAEVLFGEQPARGRLPVTLPA